MLEFCLDESLAAATSLFLMCIKELFLKKGPFFLFILYRATKY